MGIVVEHIRKSFEGRPVLDDVSFEVDDGAFVSLLAPAGEGKTTLLRIIAGIEKPDSGRIYYNGEDVTSKPVQKRNIAMVFQWFVNYPSMTVYENIACPLRARKPSPAKEDLDRKVRDTAALLKIDSVLDHHPSEISGGQQQRLALARALVKDADFVFLDEPLTNLDYKLQEELRDELKSIFSGKGRGAVILGTPQPLEALALSTHVGFLHKGRMLQYGPVSEVYHRPSCKEVGTYFSHPTLNVVETKVVEEAGERWLTASDQLRVNVSEFSDTLTRDTYLLGFRAHALALAGTRSDAMPVEATVELAEVVGSDTELHLRHRGISLVSWVQGVKQFDIGEQLTAYLHPHRFFVFDSETGGLVARTHID